MNKRISLLKKVFAAASIAAMLAPAMVLRVDAKSIAKPLSEDQKIIHVLNRLGFGARPGDVAKVKAIGLQRYIDQQLNPGAIDDSVAEAKVKGLEVFNMSTAEVFAKYPNPGALLRQLEGGRVAQANAQTQKTAATPAEAPKDPDAMTKEEQQERRDKIQQIYAKYDLKPAGQLVPQIVANRVLRAVYSEKQLQEVMVDFWQNHFNVFSGKAAVRWYIPSYERDVLRKNALGNFKDLVVGTAQHPAMLFFLDNFESVSPNARAVNPAAAAFLQSMLRDGKLPRQARERIKTQFGVTDEQIDQRLRDMKAAQNQQQQRPKRGINENYARELMELHTLGVDGGYTQADIIEVAKAFTGWTITDPRGYRRAAASMIDGTEEKRLARLQKQAGIPDDVESGEFYFNPRWHDPNPKKVLGETVNEGGVKDGLKVIDILVSRPQTAKFIARKLANKFVSDNPSDALVGRVAEAFQKSKGDIKTTLKALFGDKEFFAPEIYRAKIKSPFELAVSSIRALGGNTNASPAFLAMLNKLGEVPYGYQAPTGYPDTAEDWVNTGALLERLNFAVAIASNRIPGTRVDLKDFSTTDKAKSLDRAIAEILDGDISPATKANLLKQLEQPLPDVKAGKELTDEVEVPNMRTPGQQGGQNRQARLLNPTGNPDVFKAVSLVLGTPEFQRQ
ncbi:MAG TPA: DUF1800 domain-containing protein [Pyrinomonadaceae bacterium]|nr:DUF1800 domain-containing protein [Acidobacteriota bacterium]HQZ96718.1 DUF1800 domain-containing protein [Pyrinomonadaceae bacterium]